jgi:hypothetical protein
LNAVGFVHSPPSPSLDECAFYHATDLPGSVEPDWEWDLRAGIDAYLGGVSFAGERVLEAGPASGFVTAYMDRQGADVLSVELSEHDNRYWHTWWSFSPEFLQRFLEVVGFTRTRVTFHQQLHRSGPKDMFTVVAARDETAGAAP